MCSQADSVARYRMGEGASRFSCLLDFFIISSDKALGTLCGLRS